MNKFKTYIKESDVKPAKLSSGKYSIGNQFRLIQGLQGYNKGDFFTLIPIDEECDPIFLGGIGEYGLRDKNNNKICLHAGPRIIDELFELIPVATPPTPMVEEKPQAAQAYPVTERIIVERVIVEGDKGERGERGLQGLIGPVGPAGPKVKEATREIRGMWENAVSAENQAQLAQQGQKEKQVLREIVGNEENQARKDFKVLKENKDRQD